MPLLQYGLYKGKVGAGACGTGVSGAAAAAIIGVHGVVAVPGVIHVEASRRDGAGVRMVEPVPAVASTEGRSTGKDRLVSVSAAADIGTVATSNSNR